MTQRDGMGKEVGEGFRMGNMCTPWRIHVDVWQNQYNIVKYKKKKKKKNFTNKQKLREFSTTTPAVPQMLKGSSLDRKHRKGV